MNSSKFAEVLKPDCEEGLGPIMSVENGQRESRVVRHRSDDEFDAVKEEGSSNGEIIVVFFRSDEEETLLDDRRNGLQQTKDV